MTKDKTVTISREALEWAVAQLEEDGNKCCGYFDTLHAALATPVVERQETIGIEGMPQYLILFDDTERPVETMFGEEIARKRYADISMSWNAHLFVKIDSNSRDAMFAKNNATVVTSPPAPVAVDADIAHDRAYRNGLQQGYILSIGGHEASYQQMMKQYGDGLHDASLDKAEELNQ